LNLIEVIFIRRDSSILDKLASTSPRFSHHLFPTTLTDGKRQTSCKHTTRAMIFYQELRFIIVSQGVPVTGDRHSSPLGISSSIAVKGNENQDELCCGY
jgi:hypothetical protein